MLTVFLQSDSGCGDRGRGLQRRSTGRSKVFVLRLSPPTSLVHDETPRRSEKCVCFAFEIKIMDKASTYIQNDQMARSNSSGAAYSHRLPLRSQRGADLSPLQVICRAFGLYKMMLLHTSRSTDVLKMRMKSHFGKVEGKKMEETHTVTLAGKKSFLIVAFQSHDKRSSPKNDQKSGVRTQTRLV